MNFFQDLRVWTASGLAGLRAKGEGLAFGVGETDVMFSKSLCRDFSADGDGCFHDGRVHAFIEDTLVAHRARRHGLGKRLLAVATEQSKAAGCEWLHVDFDDHLRSFYFDACGFRPTNAGLIQLADDHEPG